MEEPVEKVSGQPIPQAAAAHQPEVGVRLSRACCSGKSVSALFPTPPRLAKEKRDVQPVAVPF